MGNKAGFTLVEIIATIVLMGIIGVFSSMFLNSGVKTFLFSRTNSETALKASIALNRIGMELKEIEIDDDGFQANDHIDYKNTRDPTSLPGSRTLSIASGDAIILFVDRIPYTLLDNISSPTLSRTGDGSIEISFNVDINGVSKPFSTKIYPR